MGLVEQFHNFGLVNTHTLGPNISQIRLFSLRLNYAKPRLFDITERGISSCVFNNQFLCTPCAKTDSLAKIVILSFCDQQNFFLMTESTNSATKWKPDIYVLNPMVWIQPGHQATFMVRC